MRRQAGQAISFAKHSSTRHHSGSLAVASLAHTSQAVRSHSNLLVSAGSERQMVLPAIAKNVWLSISCSVYLLPPTPGYLSVYSSWCSGFRDRPGVFFLAFAAGQLQLAPPYSAENLFADNMLSSAPRMLVQRQHRLSTRLQRNPRARDRPRPEKAK